MHLYFDGGSVTLTEQELGFYKFSGCQSGDRQFYGALMRRLTYDVVGKWEYRAAAEVIGASDSVLAVGCGEGAFEPYCKIFKGIDIDERAIDAGRAVGRRVFFEDPADRPKAAFDVVTMFEVLEHVDDPVGFLTGAVAALKPGGQLIACVPNLHGTTGWAHDVQMVATKTR
jgi:2-polyprenyl-3-methyl-5-hydroxy-6-metoxy-1,4-benzoquinol methylase